MCTIIFNRRQDYWLCHDINDVSRERLMTHHDELPTFDARVISVDLEDALLHLLWREQDAIRNSINSMAQTYFKRSEIHGLNSGQLKEKLRENNTPWEDLPLFLKRGIYYYKRLKEYRLGDMSNNIPPYVEYNPDKKVVRRGLVVGDSFFSIKEILDTHTEKELEEFFFQGI